MDFEDPEENIKQQIVSQSEYVELQSGSQTATDYIASQSQFKSGRQNGYTRSFMGRFWDNPDGNRSLVTHSFD